MNALLFISKARSGIGTELFLTIHEINLIKILFSEKQEQQHVGVVHQISVWLDQGSIQVQG
jgi:hypothetical protein